MRNKDYKKRLFKKQSLLLNDSCQSYTSYTLYTEKYSKD